MRRRQIEILQLLDKGGVMQLSARGRENSEHWTSVRKKQEISRSA
jgi:hypothetical protein